MGENVELLYVRLDMRRAVAARNRNRTHYWLVMCGMAKRCSDFFYNWDMNAEIAITFLGEVSIIMHVLRKFNRNHYIIIVFSPSKFRMDN